MTINKHNAEDIAEAMNKAQALNKEGTQALPPSTVHPKKKKKTGELSKKQETKDTSKPTG